MLKDLEDYEYDVLSGENIITLQELVSLQDSGLEQERLDELKKQAKQLLSK